MGVRPEGLEGPATGREGPGTETTGGGRRGKSRGKE